MSLASIAVKNVGRNAFRTALTILGVGVAMLAFVLLRTVLSAWMIGAEFAAQDRVATRHKITFVMTLPKRYAEDIRQVQGVTDVTWFNWFGARVQDQETFFATMATDPESFLRVYDEIDVPQEQKEAWLANRKGALIGSSLARQQGWKVGDKVNLIGTIYPGTWEFEIAGIYTAKRRSIDQSSFWFHWNYMNESPSLSPQMKDQIGWVTSKVRSAADSPQVSKRIDQVFDSRDIQTLSMSERAMNTSFLGMLSTLLKAVDIVSLVILLIMMLILGNTIAMSVRERTQEYGVLRAIGFLPRHIAGLVLGEALAVGFAGGALGVLIAYPLVNQVVGAWIEDNLTGFFPYFRVVERDAALAIAAGIFIAVVASAIPAYNASKLHVIDALRRVG